MKLVPLCGSYACTKTHVANYSTMRLLDVNDKATECPHCKCIILWAEETENGHRRNYSRKRELRKKRVFEYSL